MRYKIILADPPWRYDDTTCRGSADSHYNTLTLKEMFDLPIKDMADDNCVLFMWATYPKLKEALELMEAWGFNYKSIAFQWVKRNKSGVGYFYGIGRWTRGNTEPCLLATKGKPKRISTSVFQIISSPIRDHSQKPDQTYVLIEKLMGDLPRIELFAREKRLGWDVWGDQLPNTVQIPLGLSV